MWWLVAFACGSAPEVSTPLTPTPVVSPDDAALAKADAAATALGERLQARMAEATANGGPAAAVEVCAGEAQALTASIGAEHGVRVGRTSVRLRNPADAAPDWVAPWLAENSDKRAGDVFGFARVDEVGGTRKARVLKPISVHGRCLTCHGPKERVAPEVVAVLAAKYPDDQAFGYGEGDVRGALWAEVDVGP